MDSAQALSAKDLGQADWNEKIQDGFCFAGNNEFQNGPAPHNWQFLSNLVPSQLAIDSAAAACKSRKGVKDFSSRLTFTVQVIVLFEVVKSCPCGMQWWIGNDIFRKKIRIGLGLVFYGRERATDKAIQQDGKVVAT